MTRFIRHNSICDQCNTLTTCVEMSTDDSAASNLCYACQNVIPGCEAEFENLIYTLNGLWSDYNTAHAMWYDDKSIPRALLEAINLRLAALTSHVPSKS